MKQKKEEKSRLLARTLAKELTPEDLKAIHGNGTSTLVATLPNYREDQ